MSRKQRHQNYIECPVEAALDIIGGKWKPVILLNLVDGTKRFNALRRLMPNITQRMLTNQLREMETDGILHRKIYPQVPPKVEYSLTELGRTLIPLLLDLRDWGTTYALPLVTDPAPIEKAPDIETMSVSEPDATVPTPQLQPQKEPEPQPKEPSNPTLRIGRPWGATGTG